MATILIIDDNPQVAKALSLLFSLADHDTLTAASPAEGLALLKRGAIDLVVQDMNFTADTTSGEEGEALFAAIRAEAPDLPVILLTAWTHLDRAVALVKAGAADYLQKPWDDQRLLAAVGNLLELRQTSAALKAQAASERRAREALARQYDLRGIVYADPATERVLRLACQIARADVPVLITGPNGAGKERIAELIQANSSVRDGPFVTLNCGALPAELIEAELFGAEAGAYTGAQRSREGKFEAANGGTLFLDEIGNLPLAGQMKLLRVLETGRFQRLGSNRETQVRVRVISATNAELPAMIREGRFREDLYYRLNLIEIHLPPLHERPRDILPLVQAFLPTGRRLSTAAAEALIKHPWPGNVRELKNTMQRAMLLALNEQIDVADLGLPRVASVPAASLSQGASDEEPDRAQIEAAIQRAGGVIAQAAAELGLSRQALYRRLERLGMKR